MRKSIDSDRSFLAEGQYRGQLSGRHALDDLAGKGYEVVVRPHPQQVRLQQDKMDRLKESVMPRTRILTFRQTSHPTARYSRRICFGD